MFGKVINSNYEHQLKLKFAWDLQNLPRARRKNQTELKKAFHVFGEFFRSVMRWEFSKAFFVGLWGKSWEFSGNSARFIKLMKLSLCAMCVLWYLSSAWAKVSHELFNHLIVKYFVAWSYKCIVTCMNGSSAVFIMLWYRKYLSRLLRNIDSRLGLSSLSILWLNWFHFV